MDEDVTAYLTRTPRTDAFRIVSHLSVELGNGLSIPLEKIVEREAQERVRLIIDEHLEIKARHAETKKALTEWSMRACETPKIDGEFPV